MPTAGPAGPPYAVPPSDVAIIYRIVDKQFNPLGTLDILRVHPTLFLYEAVEVIQAKRVEHLSGTEANDFKLWKVKESSSGARSNSEDFNELLEFFRAGNDVEYLAEKLPLYDYISTHFSAPLPQGSLHLIVQAPITTAGELGSLSALDISVNRCCRQQSLPLAKLSSSGSKNTNLSSYGQSSWAILTQLIFSSME